MRYSNPIEFPGLGIGPFDPSPTAFSIFGHPIQWYGIIIAIGFLLAAAYGIRRAHAVGISGENVSDALLFAVPSAIIGARLYYIVFNWEHFKDNPISMLYIWNGGVAIYGAVIGGLLAAFIYAKVKKISPFAMLDIASLGFLIGQCIGRWGNFVNREVFGTTTSLPWRMELYSNFAGERVAVHPVFLYESLWNLLGFVILHNLLARRRYDGQIFLCYVLWYGFGRGLIETLRVDNLYLWGTDIHVSQVLGFGTAIVAMVMLILLQAGSAAKSKRRRVKR